MIITSLRKQLQQHYILHYKLFIKILLSLFIVSQWQILSLADIDNDNNFSDLFIDDKNNTNDANKNTKKSSYQFYNEDKDKTEGISRKDKNYAKIGAETYSQSNIWKKYYVGIDIYWQSYGFGHGQKNITAHPNFWRRFQNLNVFFGARIYKYFGVELGYSYFGNLLNKYNHKQTSHAPFIGVIFYTPSIDLKYTSINGYISAGGSMLLSAEYRWKPRFTGKFGAGVMLTIYGNLALTLGVDYYTRMQNFNNKGFASIKTGFSFYLS